MWPDPVSNPGPLTYESGALLTAVRGTTRAVQYQAKSSTSTLFITSVKNKVGSLPFLACEFAKIYGLRNG